MTGGRGGPAKVPTVEGLPADWRGRAKALRRYGSEPPAHAHELCAGELEEALVNRDEITYSLVEAARESGYSREQRID